MLLLGFIDAHMHTAMALLRGLAQDTRNWMMYGLGPFSAQLSEAAMAAGTRLAVIEALKAGTTTFGDYGWSMDDACAFLQRVGARGAITVTIREVVPRMHDPGELYEFDSALGDQRLAENLRVFDRWHTAANGRVRVFSVRRGPTSSAKNSCKRCSARPESGKRRSTCTPPRATARPRRCTSATANAPSPGSTRWAT